MPGARHAVGAPAPVHVVRPYRLLRQLAGPARDGPLPQRGAPDPPVVRAGRGLVLLLHRRHRVRDGELRPEPVAHLTPARQSKRGTSTTRVAAFQSGVRATTLPAGSTSAARPGKSSSEVEPACVAIAIQSACAR